MRAIEVEDIKRNYVAYGLFGQALKQIHAVRGITFHVNTGELYGLLGPNGAGKTTTIKMLTTMLVPTSGKALVLGMDVVTEANRIRPHIGFATGTERGLYWALSARDNLLFFAALYGLSGKEARMRVDGMLELVGLKDRANERVGGYSKGMKQRVHIARTLLSRPKVLFLDEPTLGLDPVAARELRQVLRQLQQNGQTTILTSHYMQEVEELCNRVGVINKGLMVAEGAPQELTARYAPDDYRVVVQITGPLPEKNQQDLETTEGISVNQMVTEGGKTVITLNSREGGRAVSKIIWALNGLPIAGVDVKAPSLEDAYVRLISQE